MRFDEVITNPIGTLLRRESWPCHWWVEISCTPGGRRTLRHTAISTGHGPFGDVSIGDHIDMVSVTFDAACATDWTVLDEPPIKIIDSGDHAIFVELGSATLTWNAVGGGDINAAHEARLADGRMIFVEELPSVPGRMVTVLDLREDL